MENMYLIGMSGCGKTTVGEMLARYLEVDFIDTDQIITVEGKFSISEIFSLYGEEYFRDLETAVLEKLAGCNNTVISCGGGMPLREINLKIMRQSGKVVYIERDVDKIMNCIDEQTRPLIQKDKNNVRRLYEERRPVYESAADIKILNNSSVEEAVEAILAESRP